LGGLIVVSALWVIRWSVRTWRDPDSLDPDSWAYRRYVSWMRVYQHDKWKDRARSARAEWRYDDYSSFRASDKWKDWERPVKLADEDIVALAILNLIGGVLLLCVGVLVLIGG
jgi:hypothetical protein